MASEAEKDEAKGRVKEAVGSLKGDDDLQEEGKKDRQAADLKKKVGDAQDKANEVIDKFTK